MQEHSVLLVSADIVDVVAIFLISVVKELVSIYEAAGVQVPVYSVLTNAKEFEFYTIDPSGDIYEWKLALGRAVNLSYGAIEFGTDKQALGETIAKERAKWTFKVKGNHDTEEILGLLLAIFTKIRKF